LINQIIFVEITMFKCHFPTKIYWLAISLHTFLEYYTVDHFVPFQAYN